MHRIGRWLLCGAALLMLAGAACTQTESNARVSDRKLQERTLEKLQREMPAPEVNYAPTRRTVIDWIKRWDQPDKVSFVYLLADNGQQLGYFVLRGLPVSYCVGLTAPDQPINDSNGEPTGGTLAAPGLDGVYYSGGDCNHYYGFDAGTNAYVEIGAGVRFFASDQPLPIKAPPLGITTIDDTKSPGFKTVGG